MWALFIRRFVSKPVAMNIPVDPPREQQGWGRGFHTNSIALFRACILLNTRDAYGPLSKLEHNRLHNKRRVDHMTRARE